MAKSVIIVDDHLLFARSLKILVNSFQDYEVLELFSNGRELISYFEANHKKPDIILLDIRMPIMDGLETMAWLKENHPAEKVLALTMEDDEKTIISMLRLGANGYLLKDIDPEEFFFALETLMKEGFYDSEFIQNALKHKKNNFLGNLTDKEVEFIRLSCSELTYKEIAERMLRSPKTIDGYREHLFEKLHLKSRTGLVMYAIRKKLVSV
ncbi:MAG TPA: response regulator transcription factor [Salinimicrobium sp.]|nr:response regulator transcription factor [Salinimicrobium sp.]